MTPPAIGPAADPPEGLPDDDEELDDDDPMAVHWVRGQLSHPPLTRAQVSSDLQAGQGGGWAGHWTHLLKRVGDEKSASIDIYQRAFRQSYSDNAYRIDRSCRDPCS